MPSSPLVFFVAVILAFGSLAAAQAPALQLTPEEVAWVQQHPKVRLGVDPAWPPFSFIGKDGAHQGIDAEILQLIAARTGIKFVLVPTASWAETVEIALAGRLEVVPGTARTDEREKFANFTRPYISNPVAVVMRQDAPFWVGLTSLFGHKVAMPRDYVTTNFLASHYPELDLVLTKDLGEALELVAKGDADAVVANLVVLSHLIKTHGLRNLKIVGLTRERFDLRFAVRKDQPELLAILDKALGTITEREEFAILDRWISVNLEDAINWPLIRKLATWVLLVGGGIFGAGLIWNRRLAHELTERRKAEAALRVSEEELRAANAGLQTLNNDRRMLMSMVAHDLNSPLTMLTLGVDLARSQVAAGSPVRDDDLAGMQSAAQRMTTLLSNLLSAEAIEQGERKLRRETVVLAGVVREVIGRAARTAEKKGIALGFRDETGGSARLLGDASALDQILENLVSNALKFTPPGGRVEVALEGTPSALKLSVADTGPGVSATDRPRLFEKFSRLSARPTGGESSSGLGLAIVRLLTRASGGEIECQDATGGGAKFVVTLPRLD